MFQIIRECATGQGEHSPYVYITKLLNHKQQGEDLAAYNKEFKEVVADITRLGQPKDVLTLYIAGLNQEQFRDQLQRICGSRKRPNCEELSAELMTYAIAMKGVNDLKKESGGALVMGNQGTVKNEAFCYNCCRKGHRSRTCSQARVTCGHAEEQDIWRNFAGLIRKRQSKLDKGTRPRARDLTGSRVHLASANRG
jgi:hypothetical protein